MIRSGRLAFLFRNINLIIITLGEYNLLLIHPSENIFLKQKIAFDSYFLTNVK